MGRLGPLPAGGKSSYWVNHVFCATHLCVLGSACSFAKLEDLRKAAGKGVDGNFRRHFDATFGCDTQRKKRPAMPKASSLGMSRWY